MKKHYSPNEVGAILGFSGQTIRNWCQARMMPHTITPSGRYRISEEALQQWIADRTVEAKHIRTMEETLAM